jgi:hypothetical protein
MRRHACERDGGARSPRVVRRRRTCGRRNGCASRVRARALQLPRGDPSRRCGRRVRRRLRETVARSVVVQLALVAQDVGLRDRAQYVADRSEQGQARSSTRRERGPQAGRRGSDRDEDLSAHRGEDEVRRDSTRAARRRSGAAHPADRPRHGLEGARANACRGSARRRSSEARVRTTAQTLLGAQRTAPGSRPCSRSRRYAQLTTLFDALECGRTGANRLVADFQGSLPRHLIAFEPQRVALDERLAIARGRMNERDARCVGPRR